MIVPLPTVKSAPLAPEMAAGAVCAPALSIPLSLALLWLLPPAGLLAAGIGLIALFVDVS